MNNKLLIARLLRIVFAVMVIVWGILMWRGLPVQIPVHFDAALVPDEYSPKKSFVWIFLFAFASFLPVPKGQADEDEKNKDVKTVIMNWAHTLFMCAIFIAVMVLVKKNLR